MERKLLKGGGVHTGRERCNIFPLAGPDLRQGLGPARLGLKEKPAPWGGESLAAPTPTAKSPSPGLLRVARQLLLDPVSLWPPPLRLSTEYRQP